MKSKEESRPAFGVKKTEYMQASSFNFIENEKIYNTVQTGDIRNYQPDECDSTIRPGKHTSVKNIARSDDVTEQSKTSSRTYSEIMAEQTLGDSFGVSAVTTETRKESGRYAPKRYVTTCYFQPKANPVSYSETVILTLGSNKKNYFETVLYQTKLIPFRWTESMTTSLTPAAEGEVFETRHEAFVQEPKFHYMSLEPQQTAAVEKQRAAEEIAV